MPDTTHWIVVRTAMDPYEIHDHEVEDHLRSHGECVHLVPTRVWRDYQATAIKLVTVRDELRTYRRATLVVQAAKPGFPMPSKP